MTDNDDLTPSVPQPISPGEQALLDSLTIQPITAPAASNTQTLETSNGQGSSTSNAQNSEALPGETSDALKPEILKDLTSGQIEAGSQEKSLASRAREEISESHDERWLRLYGQTWKLKFLQGLKAYGVITAACRVANVSRETVHRFSREDEAFAKETQEALEASVDAVELALRLNATEGQSRPVSSNGKIIAWYRDRSDKAADILLRAHRPGKYRGEGAAVEVSIKLASEAEVSSATRVALAALHGRKQPAIETEAIEDEEAE